MPDPVKTLTRRFIRLATKIAIEQSPLVVGTVLSRNPDGTLNYDDGKGGCVLVGPPANTRTGGQVILTAPSMSQIKSSGMPSTFAPGKPSVPQVNHNLTPYTLGDVDFEFVDQSGSRFTADGDFIANGSDNAAYTNEYFYVLGNPSTSPHTTSISGPTHADLVTGQWTWEGTWPGYIVTSGSGNVGDNMWFLQGNGDNPKRGDAGGISANLLCGLEIPFDPSGVGLTVLDKWFASNNGGPEWNVVMRDVSTYEIVASDPATYLRNYFDSRPDVYWGEPAHPGYYHSTQNWLSVSTDPVDKDFFWISICGTLTTTGAVGKMFKIDHAGACWEVSGEFIKNGAIGDLRILNRKPGTVHHALVMHDSISTADGPSIHSPGRYAKYIPFQGDGSTVSITATSEAMFTFIYVLEGLGTGGTVVAQGRHIDPTAFGSQPYTIEVTTDTYFASPPTPKTGSFVLAIGEES